MNSLERCLAVLHGQQPDRIPVVPQCFMMAARALGYGIGEISDRGDLLAESHIQFQRRMGYDGIVIDVDDASLAEACGAAVIQRKQDVVAVNEAQPLVSDLREIPTLPIPDPQRAGRLPVWLEATRRVSEAVGDHVFILGRADQGPFSLVCLLRGTEGFMEDLLTEDEAVIFAALDWAVDVCSRFAVSQIGAGAHATSMGDSLASPNLISPQMYRRFALPYEKKVVDRVHAAGGIYSVHICGDTRSILADMAALECDILELDWKVDLGEARRIVPRKTVLMGNINPSDPLYLGSTADVQEKALEVLEQTGGKSVFLSSGCAMGSDTPVENLQALIRAVW